MKIDRLVSLSEGTDGGAPGPVLVMMVRAQAKDSTQVVAGEQEIGLTLRVRFLVK